MKKVHFIAIGGSAMHNIALALHQLGHQITGSDDAIYSPSKDKLAAAGLLPEQMGWFPEKITQDLDFVVLGMHAKADNPELKRAQELNLTIYSYPQLVYELSKHKHRVVIAGSHGKTTTTALVVHVLKHCKRKFDYVVGGEIRGFEETCVLSEDAPLIVIEGDEYPASCLDKTPKMRIYQPHILSVSGLSWDHANVYTTEEIYFQQFRDTVQAQARGTNLILNADDKRAKKLQELQAKDTHVILYDTPKYKVRDNIYHYYVDGRDVPTKIVGKHNMNNIEAAYQICNKLSVEPDEFAQALISFEGVEKRLEKIYEIENKVVYRDFAHAPSKVRASVEAMYELYHKSTWSLTQGSEIVACLELHTFSSLSPSFLPQYEESLKQADYKIVYISDKVVKSKGLATITDAMIQESFDDRKIKVCRTPEELILAIKSIQAKKLAYLFMSSGTFDDMPVEDLFK